MSLPPPSISQVVRRDPSAFMLGIAIAVAVIVLCVVLLVR